MAVLDGAEKALTGCRVVCCEIHPGKMRAAGCDPETLFDWLAARGYQVVHRYIPPKHERDPSRAYHVILVRALPS
jgi:hypothetical protein